MDLNRHYRKWRRAVFLKKIGRIAGVFFATALMSWGFFWIPYFRITNIVADDYISGSELERAISPYLASVNRFRLPQNNFFLFDPGKIVELLKEKEVGVATADKKFPKTLEIKFPDTEPWLIYCAPAVASAEAGHSDGKCYYISPSGFLTDSAPRFSENPLPRITTEGGDKKIGDSLLSDDEIFFLKTATAELKKIGITIKEIAIAKDIRLSTKENWYLLIDKDADIAKVFADLKLLLEQKIKEGRVRLEYIDMRFENKAFYKLRD